MGIGYNDAMRRRLGIAGLYDTSAVRMVWSRYDVDRSFN